LGAADEHHGAWISIRQLSSVRTCQPYLERAVRLHAVSRMRQFGVLLLPAVQLSATQSSSAPSRKPDFPMVQGRLYPFRIAPLLPSALAPSFTTVRRVPMIRNVSHGFWRAIGTRKRLGQRREIWFLQTDSIFSLKWQRRASFQALLLDGCS
jgi:hypothetical protein